VLLNILENNYKSLKHIEHFRQSVFIMLMLDILYFKIINPRLKGK